MSSTVDAHVTASVRQANINNGNLSGCTTGLNFCGDQKIYSIAFCNSTSGGVIQQQIQCSNYDVKLCEAVPTVKPNSTSFWRDNSASTDLMISCKFNLDSMIVRCGEDNCKSTYFEIFDNNKCDGDDDCIPYTSYNAINENATFANIRQYLNTYGSNEFKSDNIQSLQDNLFPTLCFSPSNTCRNNSSTGIPMEKCSMIYSSSELGGLCFDWYVSQYNGLMAQRIDAYCNTYSTTDLQWWPDETGNVDPVYTEFSSNDCECVNRFSEPNYQLMRQSTNVIYNDACWYTVCIPDYNQLKPEITMFDPTCPSSICAQIVNVVNSSIGKDLNVNQYINCSTSTSVEQDLQKTFNSTLMIVIFIFVSVLILFLILLFAL